jgi:hypothetical protein
LVPIHQERKEKEKKNKIGPTVEAQFAINNRKLKIKNK